jgi:hypothetical protein
MENNQEHKIDKIFRETFENQSFTPPSDAWMGIHTYTIGQEESKKKVWLRYASLALLFLLVSGLGIWYFVDNQVIKLANNSSISPVAGLPTSPLVRKHTQKSILPTTGIAVTSISPRPIVHEHTPTLLTQEVDWSGDKPQGEEVVSGDTDHGGTLLSHELLDYASQWKNTNNNDNIDNKLTKKEPLIIELVDDSLMKDEIEFVEPVCYFNQYKIAKIDFKPLTINDLSDKMQNESERKIVALEEKLLDKKEVYKPDSVVYGKGFSLKHPIISYGLGFTRSFWGYGINGLSKKLDSYYIANGSTLKLSVAWKINKKLRMGVGLSTENFNLGVPYRFVEENNNVITSKIYLRKESLGKYYTGSTPFGYIDFQPTWFYNTPTNIPNVLDSVRTVIYTTTHSMRVTALSITSQYDILSKIRKKGKKFGYQFYGLGDFIIQRQTSYSYIFSDEKSYLKSLQSNQNALPLSFLQGSGHLEGASEYTFGLRIGLGFRWQLARKCEFYLESSGQSTFNSWFKDSDLNQKVISVQAGFNLNL